MAYNFFGQQAALPSSVTPEMLAQAMQVQSGQNTPPQQPQQSQSPSPELFAKMMQSQKFDPSYADNAGVSGNTLNQYGIAPGQGGNIFGLGTMPIFGGGGNPLNLSHGSQFSPSDITALRGAFNG